MLVGFDMFQTIIDSVGGIDVEVTEKEAQFMRATARATREIQSGRERSYERRAGACLLPNKKA